MLSNNEFIRNYIKYETNLNFVVRRHFTKSPLVDHGKCFSLIVIIGTNYCF